MEMSKSWVAVLAPLVLLIVYGIGSGYAIITGIELTEGQQSALSEIITNLLYALAITSATGGSVGIAKILKGQSKP
jgi:hypothetical protein